MVRERSRTTKNQVGWKMVPRDGIYALTKSLKMLGYFDHGFLVYLPVYPVPISNAEALRKQKFMHCFVVA